MSQKFVCLDPMHPNKHDWPSVAILPILSSGGLFLRLWLTFNGNFLVKTTVAYYLADFLLRMMSSNWNIRHCPPYVKLSLSTYKTKCRFSWYHITCTQPLRKNNGKEKTSSISQSSHQLGLNTSSPLNHIHWSRRKGQCEKWIHEDVNSAAIVSR